MCQEDTQIGRYRGDNKGHYGKHFDAEQPKDGIQRKLSVSILLNDPSEFEGGELQFTGVDNCKVLTKQGSIVVFPSFVEHLVTPVTKGVRYSAVTWASGPAFR
jgi:PKHD-type hydroxylase